MGLIFSNRSHPTIPILFEHDLFGKTGNPHFSGIRLVEEAGRGAIGAGGGGARFFDGGVCVRRPASVAPNCRCNTGAKRAATTHHGQFLNKLVENYPAPGCGGTFTKETKPASKGWFTTPRCQREGLEGRGSGRGQIGYDVVVTTGLFLCSARIAGDIFKGSTKAKICELAMRGSAVTGRLSQVYEPGQSILGSQHIVGHHRPSGLQRSRGLQSLLGADAEKIGQLRISSSKRRQRTWHNKNFKECGIHMAGIFRRLHSCRRLELFLGSNPNSTKTGNRPISEKWAAGSAWSAQGQALYVRKISYPPNI